MNMIEKNCEEKCFFFHALMRIDPPLALRSREAREEILRGEEYPGSRGSMCGDCITIGRNGDALRRREDKSSVPKGT